MSVVTVKWSICRLVALSSLVLAVGRAACGDAPRIDSIEPSQGPIAGGTLVTIRGSGLLGASLTVDTATVAPEIATSAEITFETPPHDNGIAMIKIAGAEGTAHGVFLYSPPRLPDLPAGYITTVAGIGAFVGYYGPANKASLTSVPGLAFDRNGNLYLAEPGRNRVSRIRPDGVFEPFAGNGTTPNSEPNPGDGGSALEARINYPYGVTTDSDGSVYIAENQYRIRRVDGRTGIITTIAGSGTPGFSGDGGPATLATLGAPPHITGDGKGTIYFMDFDSVSRATRIRKVTPDGIISTVAGVGSPGFSGDGGPATLAQFDLKSQDRGSLALDSEGNLFIADYGNFRVRRIDGRTGIITTVAGPEGPPDGGTLRGLNAIAVDTQGNLFYHYFDGGPAAYIVKINPAGETVAMYGKGRGFCEDGTPVEQVSLPTAIDALIIDATGNIVYADTSFSRVRCLNLTTGRLETVAGIGPHPFGETGPATAAVLYYPADLAFLPTGELIVGDGDNFLLRKIDHAGNISTIGGPCNDSLPHCEDQPAVGAYVYAAGLEIDATARIHFADAGALVWRIDPDGIMRRVAGGSAGCELGFSGDDGAALNSLLCQAWDIAFDRAWNLFIADTNNNRIRRVDAQTGIITTVAGSGPVNGAEAYGRGSFSGDGGPATEACLNSPQGVAVDPAGNLYIADTNNDRIRKVDSNGIITTVVEQVYPVKLAFDGNGGLYTGTHWNINRVDQNGAVTQLTGQGEPGFSGDGGPALQARIRVPGGPATAIDREGNLFFADAGNHRIRAIRYGAVLTGPAIATQPAGQRVNVGQAITLAVVAMGIPPLTYQWRKDGVGIPSANVAEWTITNPQRSDSGSYTVVVTNNEGSVTSAAAVVTVKPRPAVRRHLREGIGD